IGPGDRVDAARFPWGWENPDFDDSAWPVARNYHHADPQGQGTDNLWTLLPRSIPMMEETPQRGLVLRRATGLNVPTGEFL
ncbi:MAG: hypothetical protein ACEQR8_04985, partial [Cypionkella sp.]